MDFSPLGGQWYYPYLRVEGGGLWWRPEAASLRLEARGWMPEAGSLRVKAQGWRAEVEAEGEGLRLEV